MRDGHNEARTIQLLVRNHGKSPMFLTVLFVVKRWAVTLRGSGITFGGVELF